MRDQCAPRRGLVRLRLSMLLSHGVNSHVEMACAITLAGFDALKVHMTDLQTGRARLADFSCGVASQPVHG